MYTIKKKTYNEMMTLSLQHKLNEKNELKKHAIIMTLEIEIVKYTTIK